MAWAAEVLNLRRSALLNVDGDTEGDAGGGADAGAREDIGEVSAFWEFVVILRNVIITLN
jgi:hypothetical protein